MQFTNIPFPFPHPSLLSLSLSLSHLHPLSQFQTKSHLSNTYLHIFIFLSLSHTHPPAHTHPPTHTHTHTHTQVTFFYNNSPDDNFGRVAQTIVTTLPRHNITVTATKTWATTYHHGYDSNPFVSMIQETYKDSRSEYSC